MRLRHLQKKVSRQRIKWFDKYSLKSSSWQKRRQYLPVSIHTKEIKEPISHKTKYRKPHIWDIVDFVLDNRHTTIRRCDAAVDITECCCILCQYGRDLYQAKWFETTGTQWIVITNINVPARITVKQVKYFIFHVCTKTWCSLFNDHLHYERTVQFERVCVQWIHLQLNLGNIKEWKNSTRWLVLVVI